MKCLNKTMDSSGNGPEKYELFVMREKEGGGVEHKTLTKEEVKEIIDKVEEEGKAAADA